jgi:hypothetical protein
VIERGQVVGRELLWLPAAIVHNLDLPLCKTAPLGMNTRETDINSSGPATRVRSPGDSSGDRDLHAGGCHGDTQALGGGIELDRDAVIVSHLGDTGAAAEREASAYPGEDTINVICSPQTGYMPGRGVLNDAHTAQSDPADVEWVALTLKNEGSAAPGVADTGGNLTAGQLDGAVRCRCRGRRHLEEQQCQASTQKKYELTHYSCYCS